ncbi:hypothetical protein BP5796_02144 [Coleophoma crateriformis]|uniref:F-box domain-containing protein n=1 Tax=Coleophoma crateriformis TaxID=565419 RepID=A0A3D8SXI9_9HELO|nr:hypothetical protein BP5796_02144 [Coleophoma crateriformis]
MVVNSTGIGALPNELFITILSGFSTRALLPMTTVSHHFHDIVLRILHTRLLHVASLKDHKLILEVYHPANKRSTPYLFCDFLGTDGLSDEMEGEGDIYQDVKDTGRLGKLSGLYSHFRPVQPENTRRVVRSHPAGGPLLPASWLAGPLNALVEDHKGEYVCQNINLESYELFSQLCTITSLAKVGSRPGLLSSCVNIGDSVLRIWRDWLSERATALLENDMLPIESQAQAEDADYSKRLLWADNDKNVGLRLRVSERRDPEAPILLSRDEDAPISYALEYEGNFYPLKRASSAVNVNKNL